MNKPKSPDGTELLDIGNGLQIGRTQSGVWQVCAKNGCFDLQETADFWRVVTLLERPYSEVDLMFKGYTEKVGAKNYFPLWKVVSAGLAFEVDQWASLALVWFPHLEQSKKVKLGGLLEEVAHSKWASQKSRQLASRYAKQCRMTQ